MRKELALGGACCAAIALIFASGAQAGCGDTLDAKLKRSLFVPSEYGSASLQLVFDENIRSIVGMWSAEFVSGGKVIDSGYAVWHADGTEFFNSAGERPPHRITAWASGRKSVRPPTSSSHLGLSYDTSGNRDANVIISETVTVSQNGKSFSGPFTIDAYDLTGTTLLQHVAGEITATRITVD
ncbi:MAG: hypothetical protein WDN69_20425 [Aliidongia sp.]